MANYDNSGVTLANIRSGAKFVYDAATTGSADIKEVQGALQCLAYYPGVSEPDGNYGRGTEAAVKGFQNENGLNVTGNFDAATLAKLETFVGKLTTSTATPTLSRVQNGLSYFKSGHSGAEILTIQSKLANAGFTVPATGVFDANTVTAVKEFQRKYGLSADGTIGQVTLAVLNDYSNTGWISGTTVKLTPGKLARCGFKKIALRSSVITDLNNQLTKYGINTKIRVQHFLSQALAEGGGYSFTEFSYKPGTAGSKSYAPYYGAGWIQVTWEDAYTKFKAHMQSLGTNDSKILTPDLYATQHMAVKYPAQCAGWFWRDYKNISAAISSAANDKEASNAVTKKILGEKAPSTSLTDRYDNLIKVQDVLK